MPVDYLQIHKQITGLGQKIKQREAVLMERRQQALNLLKAYDLKTQLICERIQQEQKVNSSLRCAMPVEERLMQVYDTPLTAPGHVILAADGSQINPNFHDPVAYSVVNSGAFRMVSGLPQESPSEKIKSVLLLHGVSEDENNNDDGPSLSEEIITLQRDLNERKFLVELSSHETYPVVALTDGPLELFRDPKANPQLSKLFEEYLLALENLSALNTVTAGYVDRPRSDLVIRMLKLMPPIEDQSEQAPKNSNQIEHVTDLDLFRMILQPGQRSVLFSIQPISGSKFKDQLALHFFYINVGFPGAPSLARVEIPNWVVKDNSLLSLLHFSLMEQCRLLGSHPFPYALHRAHEIAVVRFEEKDEITRMIIKEYYQQGHEVPGSSNKQIHKDHSGIKKRYKI